MKKTIKRALLLCLVSLACMLTLTACDITDILGNNSQETTPEETSTEEISPEHPSQHIMGEWVPIEEPTCGDGDVVCRRDCTECDYEETNTFYVETDSFLPDDWHCEWCEKMFAEQEKYFPVPSTGSIGLSYTFHNDGVTCTVTSIGTCTDTEIRIPKTINGYNVTSIGEGAFLDCSNITSITIPDSVTTIGKNAFQGCSGITTIIFEGTVEQWGDICLDYDWYVDTSANEVECSNGGRIYFREIGG